MTATKHDEGKPAYHLIDVDFDYEVIEPWGQHGDPVYVLNSWAQRDDKADLGEAFRGVVCEVNTENHVATARLELARVLAHGAEKYTDHNWRGGFEWSRLWRAAYGHIQSHRRGDLYDAETGLLHLTHAMGALMFLYVHQRDGLGTDDRSEVWPKSGDEPVTLTARNGVVCRLDAVASRGLAIWVIDGSELALYRGKSVWKPGHEVPLASRDAVVELRDEMRRLSWGHP